MAHPDRADLVNRLTASLDRPVPVVWDRVGREWDTGRRALLAYEADATHHVVLQDDADPCPDLLAGLESALAAVPEHVAVGLYVGGHSPHGSKIARAVAAADTAGARWIAARDLWWGVGVCLPVGIISRLVRDQDRSGLAEYDRRISRWLVRQGMPVWYPWPSFVDHVDAPSILAHDRHGQPRKAHRWLGTTSPLSLDWSGPVWELPNPRRGGPPPQRVTSRRPRVSPDPTAEPA